MSRMHGFSTTLIDENLPLMANAYFLVMCSFLLLLLILLIERGTILMRK
jgi:hypothetical protein